MAERHLHEVQPVDQVARWRELLADYPEAAYAVSDGWYYGALRDDDDVLRCHDLGLLIDRLMARERNPDDSSP